VHLCPEFQHELGDDELGIAWGGTRLGSQRSSMRADWQQTAKTVLVMWPLRSVSAAQLLHCRDGKSLVWCYELRRHAGILGSASLLVIVVPYTATKVGDDVRIGSHRGNAGPMVR
jgi:hypothetical protein